MREKTDAHSAMLNMCVKGDDFRMRMMQFDTNFWTQNGKIVDDIIALQKRFEKTETQNQKNTEDFKMLWGKFNGVKKRLEDTRKSNDDGLTKL